MKNNNSSNSKCIGIIGGVGPQATSYLYNKLVEYSLKEYKVIHNHEYPRVLIISEPVFDFIESKDNLPLAKKQIINATKKLISGGATCISIASNTVHILADDIKQVCEENNIEFISMIDAVVDHCLDMKYKKVGLLASPVTLKSDLYDKSFNENGCELVKPGKENYPQLGCIIKKVIADTLTEVDINNFSKINVELSKKTDVTILGCTELPLVYEEVGIDLPIVNTSNVLAKELLKYYYNIELNKE